MRRRRRSLPLLLTVLTLIALAPAFAAQEAEVEDISAEELLERIENGDEEMLILDVRTPEEYAEGHVPGAVNIPHTELAERLDEVRRAGDVEVVVYCRSGRRAGIAQGELSGAGFARLLHLAGDMQAWRAKGLPIEKPGS